MAFFQASPHLPDDEKARIEYQFQRIAESIGLDRFRLPIVRQSGLLNGSGIQQSEWQTVDQIKSQVGAHLHHDVAGLKLQTFPMQLQKVGGGGG